MMDHLLESDYRGGSPSLSQQDYLSQSLSQDSQSASVGSSLSQDGVYDGDLANNNNNEPIDTDKKKKKKRPKRSNKDKDGVLIDSMEGVNGVDSPKPSRKEKRDKGEKKTRKKDHSSKRPEPEGGNPVMTTSLSSLEFEKIINSSDPLFSDDIDMDNFNLDDFAKKTKSHLQPYQPPRARKAAAAAGNSKEGGGGIFIPCSQLGDNNTMIKFAIIGTELKNVFQVSHRLQNEAARLNSRLQILAKNIAESDVNIKNASKILSEARGDRREGPDEYVLGDRRLEELETFVIRAAQVSNVSQEKHEEHLKKLVVLEKELNKAEEKSRKAEDRVRVLEKDVFKVTNTLKCIEMFGIEAYQDEGSDVRDDDVRLNELIDKLESEESKAEVADKEVTTLRKTMERMEFFLKHACDQYTKS